ncbi:MAG: hypothetical protein HYZ53_15290 [Planctomycetes bacterium]|nr:hypothetical protein [Planctomycetota bacterium]
MAPPRMLHERLSRVPAGDPLFAQVVDLAARHQITYIDDDCTLKVIPVVPRPFLLTFDQARAVRDICLELSRAVASVPALYLTHPGIRAVLPLDADEDAFLREVWSPGLARQTALLPRWDGDVDFSSPGSPRDLRFYEVNCCAVGGIHYSPATEEVVLEALTGRFPEVVAFGLNDDCRDLLVDNLSRHARAVRIAAPPSFAIVEDRRWETGITEAPTLLARYRKSGIRATFADPREITLRKGVLRAKGRPVDLLYRNIELRDLFLLERETGTRADGMREAFRTNRVVSGLAGEFDHKSLFEAFTDPKLARAFPASTRALFRRHVPWTRLLRERRTEDLHGRRVDLPAYVRRRQADLVMKPNRSCGGQGVTIGNHVSEAKWERVLAGALRHPDTWIVQERLPGLRTTAPIARAGRHESTAELYVALGFFPSRTGLGILGRASKSPVVNVMQGGGLISFLRYPPEKGRAAKDGKG